tara:strand:+ start:903 stop:1349 length:447 start_codon:yes stop_codon:yes gene_type:complete
MAKVDAKLLEKISNFIESNGEEPLERLIDDYSVDRESSTLTILVNSGSHYIPPKYLVGEVFNFTEGGINTDKKELEVFVKTKLQVLSVKLREKNWDRINIIPTGHPMLSMHVTLMVYRITRKEPNIVCYFGNSGYREVFIEYRPILDV